MSYLPTVCYMYYEAFGRFISKITQSHGREIIHDDRMRQKHQIVY